jgi:hypothetical protein
MTENSTRPEYGQNASTTYGEPATPPPPAKKQRKWLMPAAFLVGGMLIGGGVASANKPEPVIQVQEKIVTNTVEKKVTPKECITALDLAAVMVGDLSEAPGIVGDALKSAYDHDVAGINAVTERLKTSKANLDKQKAPLAAANMSCRLQEGK